MSADRSPFAVRDDDTAATASRRAVDHIEQGRRDAEAMIKTVRETLEEECSSYCLDNEAEVALVTRAVTLRLLRDGWRRS